MIKQPSMDVAQTISNQQPSAIMDQFNHQLETCHQTRKRLNPAFTVARFSHWPGGIIANHLWHKRTTQLTNHDELKDMNVTSTKLFSLASDMSKNIRTIHSMTDACITIHWPLNTWIPEPSIDQLNLTIDSWNGAWWFVFSSSSSHNNQKALNQYWLILSLISQLKFGTSQVTIVKPSIHQSINQSINPPVNQPVIIIAQGSTTCQGYPTNHH